MVRQILRSAGWDNKKPICRYGYAFIDKNITSHINKNTVNMLEHRYKQRKEQILITITHRQVSL